MKLQYKIFLFIFILIQSSLNAQSTIDMFDCLYNSPSGANNSTAIPFGGFHKPNRTDLSGGQPAPSDAYFPVLVVFVQFKGEPSDYRGSWPQDTSPVYLNNLIARQKDTIGDWWNWYNPETEIFSSMWAEISRGKLHVISPVPDTLSSEAFSVVLPKTAQEYFTFYNYNKIRADSAIHHDIWAGITSQGLTDWRPLPPLLVLA